jgi:hypothetical protein
MNAIEQFGRANYKTADKESEVRSKKWMDIALSI